MKKEKIPSFLTALSIILAAGFVIRFLVDYFKDYPFGSAPLWLYAVVRAVEFLVPAAILLAIAIAKKKKAGREQNVEINK